MYLHFSITTEAVASSVLGSKDMSDIDSDVNLTPQLSPASEREPGTVAARKRLAIVNAGAVYTERCLCGLY